MKVLSFQNNMASKKWCSLLPQHEKANTLMRYASAGVLALTCSVVNAMGPELVNRHYTKAQQSQNITIDTSSDDAFVTYCKKCRGNYPDVQTEQKCMKALENHARYQKAVLDCLIVTFKAVVVVLEKTRDSL